jgi:tRNA threonylcarbamoyladenosine biosynthesis protein TsaE
MKKDSDKKFGDSNKCKITTNRDQTIELGKRFGKMIKNENIVVSLVGDLGSGKTTFMKGVAEALGIKEKIKSPTFVVLKEYQTKFGDLVHVDAYRLPDNFEDVGLTDYFDRAKVFIEWADNIEAVLPKQYYQISFFHLDGDKRKICIKFINR